VLNRILPRQIDNVFRGYRLALGLFGLFSLQGFSSFVLALLALLVLIRYRAMVPLMFLVFLVELLGRRGLVLLNPIAPPQSGTPVGFYINLGLLLILVVGFALSLAGRPGPADRPA
jgi:hypothetical protein